MALSCMDDSLRRQCGEWLKKALEDELSIKAILTEEGAPSTACFLSQQMAEKCLKALLIYLGIPYPKVHDLLELETLIQAVEPKIKQLHEDLVLLNRFYIETRYPGDYPTFTWDESREAFDAACRAKDFVSSNLR